LEKFDKRLERSTNLLKHKVFLLGPKPKWKKERNRASFSRFFWRRHLGLVGCQ
jgi:hypothetical protein